MNHTYINKLIIIVFLFINSNFLYSQDCMEIGNSSTYASNQGCSGTTLRACPDGMVVVGYKGRSGAHFDNYQIGCRTLEIDGSLSGSVHWTSQLGYSNGGNARGPYYCSGDKVLVGSYVRKGDWMDYLQGRCVDSEDVASGNVSYSNNSVAATGMGNANGGDDLGTEYCPQGYFATGVRSQHTTYSCGVQWECTEATTILEY